LRLQKKMLSCIKVP